jgi:hypothetical protein
MKAKRGTSAEGSVKPGWKKVGRFYLLNQLVEWRTQMYDGVVFHFIRKCLIFWLVMGSLKTPLKVQVVESKTFTFIC